MSLETPILQHIGNTIKRKVAEAFPDLTLVLAIYKDKEWEQALEDACAKENEPPVLDMEPLRIAALKSVKAGKPAMACLLESPSKTFSGLWKKGQNYALLLIPAGIFETRDDAEQGIYTLSWDAIALLELRQSGQEKLFKVKGSFIIPDFPPLYQARTNMLADTFCALMRRIEGHKNAITGLAGQRSLMSVSPVPAYKAELYPFPIVTDAAKLIYRDLEDVLKPKLCPVARAVQMTREIGDTFDDLSLRQWAAFASAAQEMAWGESCKNTILSAATYTSEESYIRPIAYIVAESLHLEPAPPARGDIYNPFADQEANERLHRKTCGRILRTTLSKALSEQSTVHFYDRARQCNEDLLGNKPIGWCAGPLLEAAEAFQSAMAEENADERRIAQKTEDAFYAAEACVSWEKICLANRFFMGRRRQGFKPDMNKATRMLLNNEKLSKIGGIFESTLQHTIANPL
ncbi:MAG: hypothetical protein KDJ75_01340 [Alphaproteobacteria bacterium]|nr:hypothetical protein [Alphaproteobacteria bacterium]